MRTALGAYGYSCIVATESKAVWKSQHYQMRWGGGVQTQRLAVMEGVLLEAWMV